jgi:hypothetical protein
MDHDHSQFPKHQEVHRDLYQQQKKQNSEAAKKYKQRIERYPSQ